MIYKTIIVNKSFGAGLALGGLRSHLAANGSGELTITKDRDDYVEVEVATYNPLVMSYVEDKLAAYV